MPESDVRILVVDDDPNLRDLLIDTLSAIGYESVGADDSRQALELLRTEKVDLVISDIKMPGMDGLDLSRTIKRDFPDLPVILITGVFSKTVLESTPADALLSKPFRIAQIEDLIKQYSKPETGNTSSAKSDSAILVVDDDDAFRVMLVEALALSGYSVVPAASGEKALQLLEAGGIGTVITDLKMPGMSGHDLLRRIRESWPELPVILITGYVDPNRDHEMTISDADGYLIKPFKIENITELLEAVRKAKTGYSSDSR